ncbi:MAG: hypothetical protein AAFX93_15580 [Verrucomicrobiota bacterium]
MTERQLRKWMLRDRMNDAWFVSKGGESLDGPHSLSSIFRRTNKAKKKVAIMHASQKNKKEPAWVYLDLKSHMRDGERHHLERKFKRRRQHVMVKVGAVVAVAAIIALLTVDFSGAPGPADAPSSAQAYMTPQERVLDRLAKNESSGEPASEWKPVIKMALAETEKFFYIKNYNEDPWPSVEIVLNGRFYLEMEDTRVEPNGDLAVPKRQLIDPDSRDRFVDLNEGLRHIKMVVPGFKELSHRQ